MKRLQISSALQRDTTVRIILIKFENNLKTYVEITRHILQTYILIKIKYTVEKNN